MKHLLLLSIICITTLSQINAQKLETKWIQEFDSKMKIIDVPLIDEDYVYVVLKKGGADYEIGTVFFQKRKISDNSLIKELEFTTKGELMGLSDFYEVNSEIYFIANIFYEKEKKSRLIVYKLDKDKVMFNEYKIIVETPIKKEETLLMGAFISFIDSKEYVCIYSFKTKESKDDDERNFILSEKGIEEVNYEKMFSYSIKNEYAKINGSRFFNKNFETENDRKFKYENEEYHIKYILGYKLHNDKYNAYSFAANQKNKKVYLMNHNIKNRTSENPETFEKDFNTSTDKKVYTNFSFDPDGNDYMSMFKQDGNVFVLKIDYSQTTGHSTLSNSNGYSDPKFTSYSDIEIAKVNKEGKFCWKINIDCDPFNIGENEIYYQLKHNDNLILFYHNQYTVINIETGEFKTMTNDYFNLGKKFKLKWQPDYKKSLVYTNSKGNEKKIGIIEFTD